MLETSSIRCYSPKVTAVKTQPVRTISREVAPNRVDPSETIRRASVCVLTEEEIVRTARRRVETGGNDQSARPRVEGLVKVEVEDIRLVTARAKFLVG